MENDNHPFVHDTIHDLENLALQVISQIVENETVSITLPIRNGVKIEDDFETNVSYANKSVKFENFRTVKNFSSAIRLVKLMHELILANKHATKRDIYYSNVPLFESQKTVDDLVDDFACKFQVTRNDLHIVASSKGVITGNVQFVENGIFIDCQRYQAVGKPILPYVEKISNFSSSASFILIVEKDAVFMRLLEDGFCNKYGCVMISGRGYPDVATRSIVIRMMKALPHVKAFVLVDHDPHGLEIANVYINGSARLSHYNNELTLNSQDRNRMMWIGLSYQDITSLNIPTSCMIELSSADIKKASDLNGNRATPAWIKQELDQMTKHGYKAEIQSLSSLSIDFLSNVYLPIKLSLI
jgi:meiotic recombination protein SPO11